ncbi:AtzE family amidohydrolase [Labrys monachus]|uniref:Aspartyl-tRNA(Asn)/glutamyl-tRNA(Gln) amidotransferase subunit A n=1 Tax=Labrys monachus TaxID=217067 RepID=A0ABU0FID7_9HYPH|nr:AtzE family amidohydrolase [Labrys monachus]MDQ0393840.1 aspartyl-tRNA(Asn)/glutamyl-tRNA(Gln) amidotransferase subunit A [Labrys monachus]
MSGILDAGCSPGLGILDISTAVRSGRFTARSMVEHALARIARLDGEVGAFTAVISERALARADAIDARHAAGKPVGALAGVPFAAKNLFDIAGLVTRAGSRINRDNPPATRDATLIERLEGQGAICLGALNMGEFAYDFTGENIHDGPARNPHALGHMAGGSSGGSASSVAAGFVPLSLASDTNGSIRVPASFCGLFSLKPTLGRLSRARTFPFVASLDHLGPLTRSARDLALAYDVMQGPDPDDPSCAERPAQPVLFELGRGIEGLRIAVATGYFAGGGNSEAFRAVERCARGLDATEIVDLPQAVIARAAAYIVTSTEAGALHRERLRQRAGDFDPAVRDRLIAGNMVPATWAAQAYKFRNWFAAEMRRLFERIDLILAPATPCRAPRLGQSVIDIAGESRPVGASLGIYTQPISLVGVPVVTVPVWEDGEDLPIGVQIVAPAWREDLALRAAWALETAGIVRAPVANIGCGPSTAGAAT